MEEVESKGGSETGWILQSKDGKTFLGRIGGGYMAMREGEGRTFGARREEWDVNDGWSVKYKLGDVEGVPSMAAVGREMFDGEEGWKVGHSVEVLAEQYVVRAWEDILNSF